MRGWSGDGGHWVLVNTSLLLLLLLTSPPAIFILRTSPDRRIPTQHAKGDTDVVVLRAQDLLLRSMLGGIPNGHPQGRDLAPHVSTTTTTTTTTTTPPKCHGFKGNVDWLLVVDKALAKGGIGELLFSTEGVRLVQLGA